MVRFMWSPDTMTSWITSRHKSANMTKPFSTSSVNSSALIMWIFGQRILLHKRLTRSSASEISNDLSQFPKQHDRRGVPLTGELGLHHTFDV